eukprot:3325283-Pyramimonas_sp.AAC.1
MTNVANRVQRVASAFGIVIRSAQGATCTRASRCRPYLPTRVRRAEVCGRHAGSHMHTGVQMASLHADTRAPR